MSEKVISVGGVPVSTPPLQLVRPSRDGRLPLSALIDAYMLAWDRGRDKTREQRVMFWRDRFGDVPVSDVTDDMVADVIDELGQREARVYAGRDADGNRVFRGKGKPLSGSTINRIVAALSAVISWGTRKRMMPRGFVNPCSTVELPEENEAKTVYLERDEIDRLLAACRKSKWPKLLALVLTAVTSGMRRGELRGLRWADVDLDKGVAQLAMTKNGTRRGVPLMPAAVAELARIKGDSSKPGDLIFGSTRVPGVAFNHVDAWAAALRAARIKKRGVTFHSLRHTAASHMAMAGVPLLDVGRALGHKTLSMSARYSHLSTQHTAAQMAKGLGDIGLDTRTTSPSLVRAAA